MDLIRVKKSFTLIELIVVILIISIVYILVFSSSSFSIKNEKEKIDLSYLKEFLLKKYNFKNEVSFLCIENDFSCFVKVDGKIDKDFKIDHFFKQKPEVYKYYKKEQKEEFSDIRIDNFNYKVIFELKIDSDYKTNEFILDTLQNEVYIFNSIFTKPKVYPTLRDSFEIFEKNEKEVKNAF